MFGQDCTCPALLKISNRHYLYGAVTLYGAAFLSLPVVLVEITGLVRVRSPY